MRAGFLVLVLLVLLSGCIGWEKKEVTTTVAEVTTTTVIEDTTTTTEARTTPSTQLTTITTPHTTSTTNTKPASIFDFDINAGISYCESIADLSDDEIENFKGISSRHLDYIADKDSTSLETSFSSPLKEAFKGQSVQKTVAVMKDTLGTVKEEELLYLFRIGSAFDYYTFCGDSISDKNNTFWVYTPKESLPYVILIYEITNEDGDKRYFTDGLIQEGGEWKIWTTNIQSSSIGRNSADTLLEVADREFDKGKDRNAIFYYTMAVSLMVNNQYIKSQLASDIEQKINGMKVEDIPQSIITEWTTDSGKTFKVYTVTPLLFKEEIGVQVKYVTANLDDQDAVDAESLELAKYVNKRFPEYREAFDAIAITAAEKMPKAGEVVNAYNNVYYFDELD